ncbi:MAG: hypothetical protein UV08_C0015G0006 [Parcubacteria group bacterium GW2011_GWA2_42_18]|nr:MAG: hypothetical protein UV08_C0015G0006 [Parcubacteria group bacterium GW2011_GWA2_42_18]
MDEKILAAMKERYEVLPQEVQKAIMSSDYQNTLIELGKKHNLNIEQLGILERETTMVLFGVIKTSEYAGELTRELNIGGERTNKLVADVNEKVFLPIRESLKIMFEEDLPAQAGLPANQRSDLKNPQGPTLGSVIIRPQAPPPAIPPERKIELTPKLVEDKMTSAFKIPKTETDHTLGGGPDPYREAIE